MVGRREPAEDERKRGDVTGPSRIEAVELVGDLLDRAAVGRFGTLLVIRKDRMEAIRADFSGLAKTRHIYCCHVPSRIHEELKQTRPFRSVAEEASLTIVRTAAQLEQNVSEALRPYDITVHPMCSGFCVARAPRGFAETRSGNG